MRILITDENITNYGLDKITDNTREELLAQAEVARLGGFDLYFTVPDVMGSETEMPQPLNVFDEYAEVEPVAPTHLSQGINLTDECRYSLVNVGLEKAPTFICDIHGLPSRHTIEPKSHPPCRAIDPDGTSWEK
jgi:hypothetical protein